MYLFTIFCSWMIAIIVPCNVIIVPHGRIDEGSTKIYIKRNRKRRIHAPLCTMHLSATTENILNKFKSGKE